MSRTTRRPPGPEEAPGPAARPQGGRRTSANAARQVLAAAARVSLRRPGRAASESAEHPAPRRDCRAARRCGRLAVVAGALVVAVGLAGCTHRETVPTPGVSAQASPTALAAGVWHLGFSSYRFKVVAKEGSYTGAIDPLADLLDASVTVSSSGASLTIDTVEVRGSAYTRLSGLPLPGFDGRAWYRIDAGRVTRPGALGLSATKDPTGVQALIAASRDVRRDGRRYRGTVDMTRVVAWGPVGAGEVLRLGDAARAVPFEAGVDEHDRLVSVTVSIADNPVTATYTDFGTTVDAVEPRDAQPLPDHLYGMLGL